MCAGVLKYAGIYQYVCRGTEVCWDMCAGVY